MEVRIVKQFHQFEVGEVINLSDHQARELIKDGYAVLALVRHFRVEDSRSKKVSEKGVIL